MNRAEIEALTRAEVEPAVTLLLPVRRSAVDHHADLVRAGQLVDDACRAVERLYPEPVAAAVIERLRHVEHSLDFSHPGDGLAVFVGPDEEHAFMVPFDLEEQLSVEATFAVRQVLAGLQREPSVRVLVLSRSGAHLFEDRDRELVEVRHGGFPIVEPRAPVVDVPHRDRAVHEGASIEAERRICRAVDAALDALADDTPIIVAAPERVLAEFEDHTRSSVLIVGRVPGNFTGTELARLELAVRPAVDAYVDGIEDDAVARVRDALGVDRAVAHFGPVAKACEEGRGRRLVIERDFSHPLHMVDGLTPGDEPDQQWTLDDAADELVEKVVRNGGSVVFVASGKLEDLGGVALELRW